MSNPEPQRTPRMQRRREATRDRIVTAANALFEARGYTATSMDDIAEAADVAARTIYLHFDSKAAVLLAYVDTWIDSFVDALLERPFDELLDDSIAAALAALEAEGWSNTSIADSAGPHPVVEFIGDGSQEIAGRIMHSWVAAQDRIADDAIRRGGYAPDSLEPRARAAMVFASWTATMLVMRDGFRGSGLPSTITGNEVGERIARLIAGTGRAQNPR